MRRVILVCVTLLVAAVGSPAAAIVNGEPDGERHPMVGALVYLNDEGERQAGCSGSLLTDRLVLTAAHCVAFDPSDGPLWVSFDPVIDPENGTFIAAVGWQRFEGWNPMRLTGDVAVVTLEEPVTGRGYVVLPEEWLLRTMRADGTLADTEFVNVGYGVTYTVGPPTFGETGTRRISTSDYGALTRHWLALQQKPDWGGICGGDSGGPHLVGDSLVVPAITTWAGSCGSMSFHTRIDTPDVLSFLRQEIGEE